MILVDRLLVGGLRFVLDKVARAVESEMNDEGSLKEDLLAAQMRLELGEIDEEELAEIERDVLERLREIQAERQVGGAVSFERDGEGGGGGVEIEVELAGDEHDRRG